jgi:hypothetical protein
MIVQGYRYKFLSSAALQEAEMTLLLALLAAEGLHGESRVRMDAAYAVDKDLFSIAVDTSTAVGDDIANIFTAFIAKELGQNKFFVRRLEQEGQA